MVGVEPKIIQCSPADRIRVLIGCERFRAPCNRAGVLSNIPRRAAIALVILGAIVCPTRFLRRRVKSNVADVNPRSQRYTERLNATVEVLVIDGIFVMPHTRTWVSHFVTHKPNPVVTWVGFSLGNGRPSPGRNGRLHLHGPPRSPAAGSSPSRHSAQFTCTTAATYTN